jgi:UDP-2,3-diacylglucosamine pyrophosphatase LpxH
MWFLAERLKNNSAVTVDAVSEQRKHLVVQGFSILLTHGTDIKSLENAAKQTMLLYGEKLDYLICGHKHREQECVSGYTDQGNSVVIRVPSLCGMDEYAQRLGYGGKPGAMAIVLEEGYGRRCVYPITLR